MNQPIKELAHDRQPAEADEKDTVESKPAAPRPIVAILAPPWPRSGAACVIKNQIDYYHLRGFDTVLVIVPFHRWFMQGNPVWEEVKEGFHELGARELFVAPLEQRRYNFAKYTASFRHAFRGSTLDWESSMARSVRLPESLVSFLQFAPPTILHVNYAQLLGFAAHLRSKVAKPGSRIPIILETHDIQSHLLQERREVNPWTRKPDRLENLVRSEISLSKKADVLVHLSLEDMSFFTAGLPRKPQVLAMPAIDEAFVSSVEAAAPLEDAIDLLFVGQKHAPNLAAMKWFFEAVWPRLAEKQYRLKIVGPVDSLIKESEPRLFETFCSCFVGPVADLAPYYRSARCVIAPMVSGSGTSIKTIEALALGKPFVGTSKAFRGMPIARIKALGLQAHDDPRDLADAVVDALAGEARFGSQSRIVYDEVFSLRANFEARDESVKAAGVVNR